MAREYIRVCESEAREMPAHISKRQLFYAILCGVTMTNLLLTLKPAKPRGWTEVDVCGETKKQMAEVNRWMSRSDMSTDIFSAFKFRNKCTGARSPYFCVYGTILCLDAEDVSECRLAT